MRAIAVRGATRTRWLRSCAAVTGPTSRTTCATRTERAIDQHFKERDKTAAARERTLIAGAGALARPRVGPARASFLPRGKKRSRNRLAIIVASLITVLLVAAVVVPPLAQGFFRSLAEANPDMMRIGLISDAVASVMDDRPDKPAGTTRHRSSSSSRPASRAPRSPRTWSTAVSSRTASRSPMCSLPTAA